jgi:hypothetical protein
MKPGKPSRTAMGAAGHRAVHQIVEGGRIFADPIAVRILGADADVAIGEAENDPSRRRMRMFIAMRSRAVRRGAKRAGCGPETYSAFGSALSRHEGRPEKLLNEDQTSDLIEVVT